MRKGTCRECGLLWWGSCPTPETRYSDGDARTCDAWLPLQEEILRRYPRLCGHLIAESMGYFTPAGAANTISAYRLGREHMCEWIWHLTNCGVKNATREVIRWAVARRRYHKGYMAEYGLARAVIAQALAGRPPELASWF